MEEGSRGGKAAATPNSAPEHRYIDQPTLHSAIPHFKGKISVGPGADFLSV